MVLVPGCGTSEGNRTSSPDPVLLVTVTFAEIETASEGIPQTPATLKFRVAFGASAGPPNAPEPTRVSMTRHGVNGCSVVATGTVTLPELWHCVLPTDAVKVQE